MQHVKRAVVAIPGWIVMVTVYRKHWNGDVEIWILVISRRESRVSKVHTGITDKLHLVTNTPPDTPSGLEIIYNSF